MARDHQTTASLSSAAYGGVLLVPATVEVLASDNPFVSDGALTTGTSPVGQIRLRFTMPTPAGTVGGTLLARFCGWSFCV